LFKHRNKSIDLTDLPESGRKTVDQTVVGRESIAARTETN
jgi:hypothetical protein